MTGNRVIDVEVNGVKIWCDHDPGGDVYVLDWAECNQPETYEFLEHTLARVAVLVRAVTEDRFFTRDAVGSFVADAEAFVEAQLNPPLQRSRFRLGQLVTVVGASERYTAHFLREERNHDRSLNGVALVRVTDHPDRRVVGVEIHVGVSTLEPA